MSRVYYNEMDDVYGLLAAGRWQANRDKVRRSKRGKAFLERLKAELLAWPEKKLYASTFAEWDKDSGEIKACVLGVHELSQGKQVSELRWLGEESADTTAEVVSGKELSWQLAWMLVELNDEAFDNVTPEQRYELMLKRIDQWLALPPWEAPSRTMKEGSERG